MVFDDVVFGPARLPNPLNGTLTEADVLRGHIARLAHDNAQLNENLTSVQARCTELVNASPQRTVGAFHEMTGQPIRAVPTIPPDDEVRTRLRLIVEEFFELLEAAVAVAGQDLEIAKQSVDTIVNHGVIHVALPELADAIADLRYVLHGTDLVFGIDGRKIDAEVHGANMAKRGGTIDASGKFRKPEGWRPPDVAGELERQGWTKKEGGAR